MSSETDGTERLAKGQSKQKKHENRGIVGVSGRIGAARES